MPTSYTRFEKWLEEALGISTINSFASVNHIDNSVTFKTPKDPFEVQSILSNREKNCFTVVWADGTKTMVHCQKGDEWDDEKALAMCFTKKALGNKGNFNDKFNDALNNKMKVILAEPAPVKACDCDGTCTECKCKEESIVDKALAKEFVKKSVETANAFGINTQTATELSTAANKANMAFKEMINALTGETIPKIDGHYKVYIRIGGTSHYDSDFTSIKALRKRVHEIAKELYGREPYYYRTWMNEGRMIIDFGHYTQFIEVEGITPDEYAKN